MLNLATTTILGCLLLLISGNAASAETIPLGKFSSASQADGLFKELNLKVDTKTYPLTKAELSSWVKEKNILTYNPDYVSEIENKDICQHAKSILCALALSLKDKDHIQKSSILYLDTGSTKRFVEDLSRQANIAPTDAKLTIENGKVSVFTLSQKGLELDKEKSVAVLANHLLQKGTGDTIDLPYIRKNPEVGTDSIDNLGITSLIGEGRSNFRGSPKNRIFNIKVATNRFNGTLIKPGEEFSFVKILGEVDGEHGYLPELVIKKDKTEPEFGGGICQVSTTAFRAAIYGGLEITARRNHAYPVSYYNPQGMDATVYVPWPDLRFINNTPGHILIQTEIAGTELIFRFFGTPDGRKINVVGPTILERKPDGSMKTTFSQQVFDADGKLIREDVFNSSYDSPDKYPHPGEVLTKKPDDWSKREWSEYLKANKR
ncbi:MAG: VanW family protein [Candidatus Moranbacteria bacterium]|nr:VanW family protein [Candidatus Moranbacteria bacterium]